MIAAYGVVIMAISLLMIVRPQGWIDRAARYCEKPFMHPLEILICLGFGVTFILYGGATRFPEVLVAFGYLLAAVGVALVFVPPSVHRRFGIWSLERMGGYFRPAGVVSLILGGLLVYAAF